MAICASEVKEIIIEIAEIIQENKQYLTDLDAAIGDGDHGINMAKGFQNVVEKLESPDLNTPEQLLKTTAMALISNVGGASGPLYGTLFLKASQTVKNQTEISLKDFYAMLENGIDGVKIRGKSDQGEKTMLDVLIPILNSLELSISTSLSSGDALENAVKAAEEGLEYTKKIAATKGRASYVGDRSIGHADPGAMSSLLMMRTINRCRQK